jgi:hypothetical protein
MPGKKICLPESGHVVDGDEQFENAVELSQALPVLGHREGLAHVAQQFEAVVGDQVEGVPQQIGLQKTEIWVDLLESNKISVRHSLDGPKSFQVPQSPNDMLVLCE